MNVDDQSLILPHMEVFEEATGLYVVRSRSYGQVWRNYGALSNLLSAARKVDRTMETWWHQQTPVMHKDALDDAMDAINYLNFFVRNAREGNITGQTPDRPDRDMPHIGII